MEEEPNLFTERKNKDASYDELPSNNVDLLRRLVGRRIVELKTWSEDSLETMLEDYYPEHREDPKRIFMQGLDGLSLEVDSGLIIKAYDDDSLYSVMVWPARTEDGVWHIDRSQDVELFFFDARDPVYSMPEFGAFVGRRISGVRVLVRPPHGGRSGSNPCEAAVVLAFETGHELVLAHNLSHLRGDFNVLLPEHIRPELRDQLRELFVIDADGKVHWRRQVPAVGGHVQLVRDVPRVGLKKGDDALIDAILWTGAYRVSRFDPDRRWEADGRLTFTLRGEDLEFWDRGKWVPVVRPEDREDRGR